MTAACRSTSSSPRSRSLSMAPVHSFSISFSPPIPMGLIPTVLVALIIMSIVLMRPLYIFTSISINRFTVGMSLSRWLPAWSVSMLWVIINYTAHALLSSTFSLGVSVPFFRYTLRKIYLNSSIVDQSIVHFEISFVACCFCIELYKSILQRISCFLVSNYLCLCILIKSGKY